VRREELKERCRVRERGEGGEGRESEGVKEEERRDERVVG
jgi:hypothetical protein